MSGSRQHFFETLNHVRLKSIETGQGLRVSGAGEGTVPGLLKGRSRGIASEVGGRFSSIS